MKIGILGGSFNPIHNGHISLAKAALNEYSLDRVLIMPNCDTYYKKDADISDHDRMNMIQLAVRGLKNIVPSDIELKRGGITYTIDTMRYLIEKDKEEGVINDYFFIIGGDTLHNLYYWREIDELFKVMTFLATVRDDVDTKEMEKLKDGYTLKHSEARIGFLHTDKNPVSSSLIRKKVAEGEDVSMYLPEAVNRYIKIRNLYK